MNKVDFAEYIVSNYYDDPISFVREIIGVEPDNWQLEALEAINTGGKLAVTSGHGVGKTALTSWIILWFMSTRPTPQIVVTANTFTQLNTKTWRELSIWHKKA